MDIVLGSIAALIGVGFTLELLLKSFRSKKPGQSAILRKRRQRIKKSNKIQEELHHSEKASLDKLIDNN